MHNISKLEEIVKKMLICSTHDYEHTQRVRNLCMMLGTLESANLEVLEVAALLHDIERPTENKNNEICHAEVGSKTAKKILFELKYEPEFVDKVVHCIKCHRFRNNNLPESIEAKILYDADKIDSIGAIGIGRAFLFGGQHGQLMHNPKLELSKYRKENICENGRIKDMSKHTPIFEYLLKLDKIKDSLITSNAKEIANHRHKFMKNFIDEFMNEWEGKK